MDRLGAPPLAMGELVREGREGDGERQRGGGGWGHHGEGLLGGAQPLLLRFGLLVCLVLL
jgi:hypothetical protein